MNQKILIVGATSGIGLALTELFLNKNFTVVATGRNLEHVNKLKAGYNEKLVIKRLDINEPGCTAEIDEVIREMNGIDYYIHCAAIIHQSNSADWNKDEEMITTNVIAFTHLIDHIFQYFVVKGAGHITIVSSIAALRGGASSPVYNATKAFQSSLAEGLFLQSRLAGKNIHILDIKPGYVQTKMSAGSKGIFTISCEKAAIQIANAILKHKTQIIIPLRWNPIAFLISNMPIKLLAKLTSGYYK